MKKIQTWLEEYGHLALAILFTVGGAVLTVLTGIKVGTFAASKSNNLAGIVVGVFVTIYVQQLFIKVLSRISLLFE